MFIFFITQDSVAAKPHGSSDASIPPSSNPPIPEKSAKKKTKPKTAPATLGTIPVPSSTDLKEKGKGKGKQKEVAFETRKESQAARDNRSNGYVSQNKATSSSSKGDRKTVGKTTTTYQPPKNRNQKQKIGASADTMAQAKLQKMTNLINSNPQARALLLGGSTPPPAKPKQTFSQHLLSVQSTPSTRAKMFKEFLSLRYKSLPAPVQKVHKAIIKKIAYCDNLHSHKSEIRYHEVNLRDKFNFPSNAKIVRPKYSLVKFMPRSEHPDVKIKMIAQDGLDDCLLFYTVTKDGYQHDYSSEEYSVFLSGSTCKTLSQVEPMDQGQPLVRFGEQEHHMEDLRREMNHVRDQVHTLSKKQGVARLEMNEEFVVSMCYKSALTFLLPELFKNFGICDMFNTDPSCYPTIPTRYTVPFGTVAGSANSCALEVSMDPEELIRVIGQGGDLIMISSSWVNQSLSGSSSNFAYNNIATGKHGVADTPSYLVSGQTSYFFVECASLVTETAGEEDFVQLQTQTIGGIVRNFYPLDTGSSFHIVANTANTTADGYTSKVGYVLLSAGVYSLSEGAAVLGTGGAVITNVVRMIHTPPANAVGVNYFTIGTEDAATSQFSKPEVNFVISAAPSDIVLPCGSSDGLDLSFIREYTPDIRPVACSFRGIAFCGALSQILAVFGQYLANEGDDSQVPTFQNYTANLRSKVKTLVGSDPGLYLPLLHRDYETVNFYNLSDETSVVEPRIVEKGFVFLKAVDTDGEYFVLESYLSLQCRPVPGLTAIDARPGTSCPEALSRVSNVLSREDLTFENPDHVEECMDIARETTSTESDWSFNINFAPSFSAGDITLI